MVAAVISELKKNILEKNINKIYQPDKHEIVLVINKYKILLSAHAVNARVCMFENNKTNPESAPNFCMILRKYIQSAKIINITQPNFDRIIKFKIKNINDFGDVFIYELVLELMGKHSNLILIFENKILDSIKHVDKSMSRVRQVLPGLEYKLPHDKNKLDLLKITRDEFFKLDLNKNMFCDFFNGIGKITQQEIFERAKNINHELIWNEFEKIICDIKQEKFKCEIVFKNKTPVCLSGIDLKSQEDFKKYASALEAMRDYFVQKKIINHDKYFCLQKEIKNKIARCEKKIMLQEKDLDNTKDKLELKLKGELILANIWQIKKNQEELYVQDYENNKLKIKLDKNLSGSQNAQVYFKKYNHKKRAEIILREQIKKNNLELEYLLGVMQNLDLCENQDDLQEIFQEVFEKKKIKIKNKKKEFIYYHHHYQMQVMVVHYLQIHYRVKVKVKNHD